MKIRTLIVDDEECARQRIRDLLGRERDIEIVGECTDGEDAVRTIRTLCPDLVFLDIQMPEMDGFQTLHALGPQQIPIIVFVTAYEDFALRAFESHAADYLLKPFDRTRFSAALERARVLLSQRADQKIGERIRVMLNALEPEPSFLERVVVRVGQRIQFVRVDEIDWMAAEGNYVRLHVGKRSHLVRESLTRLAERLDPQSFLRIHRSVVVNTERIREVQPLHKGAYAVVLQDGTKLTSTSTFREGIDALVRGCG